MLTFNKPYSIHYYYLFLFSNEIEIIHGYYYLSYTVYIVCIGIYLYM